VAADEAVCSGDEDVSSDDDDILAEASASGAVPEQRSDALARDDTPTIEVLRDFLARRPEVEVLVVLQPTSPLRATVDVQACLDALATADSVATVTRCEHPPEWSFRLTDEGRLQPVLGWDAVTSRRQDAAAAYRLNGAVYAVRAQRIRDGVGLVGPETAAVVMPPERSIDIDDELDLAVAVLMAERASQGSGESPSAGVGP
jgi:CMP-N,N'-diacetyllegionaminic acid synthase